MSVVPVRGLARRLENNPILTSAEVAPSQAALEVVSVFNAAAAQIGDETILLLRVAERPRAMTGLLAATARTLDLAAPHERLGSVPAGTVGEDVIGIAFLDPATEPPRVVVAYVRRDQPGLDVSDPRSIQLTKPPAKPGGHPEVRDYLTQISHLRVARSTDGAHFVVDRLPAVLPSDSFEEYGCEDPRATLIDGVWHITYVSVGSVGVTTSRLTTLDFTTFDRHGIMFLPDHKDVVLFPGRVHGRYVALTRPMPASFNRVLGIWIAFSDDLVGWGGHRPLALPRPGMWDGVRTGAGTVPFRVPEGWLELYHGVDSDGQYAMGGLLLDADDPSRVIARSPEPILAPEELYEKSGFYRNTVFSCGHVLLDEDGNRLRMYYGAADSCLAAADFDVKEIVASLASC
ncbi:MAG TPA: glycoside hydrolase family 130 protein [Candidatus Dormibacteraeota bacterium]|nr:glycoside hydrolase family 130 protein [Candidatus Dormibacteraeota bacterium]